MIAPRLALALSLLTITAGDAVGQTPTSLPASTPVASIYGLSPLRFPNTVEWRSKSFTVLNSQVGIVPALSAGLSAGYTTALLYLDVVASAATTVTVVVGDVSIPVVFVAGNATTHQTITFTAPPTTTGAIYATSTGASTVVVLAQSTTMRQP